MDTVLPMPRARLQDRIAVLRAIPALVALAAVVAPVTWLVVTAAQRPSVLAPPTVRRGADVGWMLGPLHALHLTTATAPHVLHAQMLRVLIIVGAAWLVAWITAPGLPLRVIAGAVALAHAVLLLAPPLPLTDVFNYQLYGRMAGIDGLNPYRDVPARAAADPIFAFSNWHHLTSPYGPLFTLATEGLNAFGVHGWLWAWKTIVLASSLGSIALVAALAGRLGVSRQRAVAAVGLSPVLLIGEVGGLHQDMPAVACLLGAAWCLVRGADADAPRWTGPAAGALAMTAAGIKPSFAIALGVLVLGSQRRRASAAGAAAVGVVLGAIVLLAYGGTLPDVSTQSSLVGPMSVPNLLGLAAGHGGADQAVRTAAQGLLALLAAGATLAVALRRERALTALGVLLFGSVLALGWVMPWYLVWALPFIALSRPRALAPLAVVATCWLIAGSLPTLPGILHSFHYYPTRLATGKANHLRLVRLVR